MLRIYGADIDIGGVACMGYQCTMNAIEYHHIRSMGDKFGARMGTERGREIRKIFSSVYNSSPLCRRHHEIGKLHRMSVEEELLRKARKKVHDAMRRGDYTITDEDRLFLERYSL